MSERLQYSIDELTLNSGMKDNLGNWTRKWGATVPSAVAGYAKGCLFTNTTSGNTYQNTGTSTSCSFTTTAAGQILNVITDPGTGVAIPVTSSGVCAITSAGAETNTLANPPSAGMILILTCNAWAVGSRVVTAAGAINQVPNTIMTLAAAGASISLYSTLIAGVPRWRVMSNDGVTLA